MLAKLRKDLVNRAPVENLINKLLDDVGHSE